MLDMATFKEFFLVYRDSGLEHAHHSDFYGASAECANHGGAIAFPATNEHMAELVRLLAESDDAQASACAGLSVQKVVIDSSLNQMFTERGTTRTVARVTNITLRLLQQTKNLYSKSQESQVFRNNRATVLVPLSVLQLLNLFLILRARNKISYLQLQELVLLVVVGILAREAVRPGHEVGRQLAEGGARAPAERLHAHLGHDLPHAHRNRRGRRLLCLSCVASITHFISYFKHEQPPREWL